MRIPYAVVLMAGAACADPIAPAGAGGADALPIPAVREGESDAMRLLLSATVFETPSRGLSFSDPVHWVAWRSILLRGEAGSSDFQYLYEHATTPEGRMYGAAGILAADPGAWTTLAADPRWAGADILVASGCNATNDPAPLLLRVLATPRMRAYFRTGSYPVEAP